MGIIGRRTQTSEWHPDSEGVGKGYDRTADNVVGNAYDVRFVRDDKPGSMITVAFYPIELAEGSGEYAIEREVEWMVCENPDDPGGTEIWSDTETDQMDGGMLTSLLGAEGLARRYAERALGDAADHHWGGDPEW